MADPNDYVDYRGPYSQADEDPVRGKFGFITRVYDTPMKLSSLNQRRRDKHLNKDQRLFYKKSLAAEEIRELCPALIGTPTFIEHDYEGQESWGYVGRVRQDPDDFSLEAVLVPHDTPYGREVARMLNSPGGLSSSSLHHWSQIGPDETPFNLRGVEISVCEAGARPGTFMRASYQLPVYPDPGPTIGIDRVLPHTEVDLPDEFAPMLQTQSSRMTPAYRSQLLKAINARPNDTHPHASVDGMARLSSHISSILSSHLLNQKRLLSSKASVSTASSPATDSAPQLRITVAAPLTGPTPPPSPSNPFTMAR